MFLFSAESWYGVNGGTGSGAANIALSPESFNLFKKA